MVRCRPPSRRPLLSFVAVAILVFSIFALLKIDRGEKQEPAKELFTGSIQKSPSVRKARSDDPTAPCRVRGQTGCELPSVHTDQFVPVRNALLDRLDEIARHGERKR
jgi:hypothetical protein